MQANKRHYRPSTRFTEEVLARMNELRYQERRSCKWIAQHYGTTERQVQRLLCNSMPCWDGRGLRVPEVTGWDFSQDNLV